MNDIIQMGFHGKTSKFKQPPSYRKKGLTRDVKIAQLERKPNILSEIASGNIWILKICGERAQLPRVNVN